MAYNSYVGGNYLHCYDYYLLYFIAYLIALGLGTMNPLPWHPPYLASNTDTLYLGASIENNSVGFSDFSK